MKIGMYSAMVALMFLPFCSGAEGNDALKQSLDNLFHMRHWHSGAVEGVFFRCGVTSNQFAQALRQVYEESDFDLVRSRSLATIPRYGTYGDIGYLMQCATNHTYWTDAARSALRLEAPSNLVIRTQQLISIDRPGAEDVTDDDAALVRWLIGYSIRKNLPSPDRQAIWDFAYSFTSNHWHQAWSLDDILQVDPTYEKSRRRKAMLQHQLSQLSQETNSCVKGYVSGELTKLQRLDDSELND